MTTPRHPGDLEALDVDESRRLLETVPFVRLGFVTAAGPTILPVNHLIVDGDVYFRTHAGSKLATAAAEGAVAVEADGADTEHRLGWSVVGHGHASIVTDEDLIERLMAFDFTPWTCPDQQLFWVRVALEQVSGRRIVGGEG